ncbi:MAG: helix-turn-helix transcriptional regulator [Candidatus Sericytochromatia bacterium]|nr:helix-turn-helix transcriptional regulator [Candidatus Sericytochromatia bacterium]
MSSQQERQIEFARRFRMIRERRGFSQEQLSFAVKLDRTYVSAIDRGERNLSLANIWKLSDALHVNPSIFFVDEQEFNEFIAQLPAPCVKAGRKPKTYSAPYTKWGI